MKFLLQVTRNHIRAFDALLDYYEDMGNQLKVLAHPQSFFKPIENGNLKAVLETIFREILKFHAEALAYFRQKGKHHERPPRPSVFHRLSSLSRMADLVRYHLDYVLYSPLQASRQREAADKVLGKIHQFNDPRPYLRLVRWPSAGSRITNI